MLVLVIRTGHGAKKLGENLVALPGEGEVFFGEAALVMRAELQGHLVEADINVRMVIGFLGLLCHPVNKRNCVRESCELESSMSL